MGPRLAYVSLTGMLMILAVLLRLWDPAPLAASRLPVFDLFQKIAPRVYDPGLPVRIIDIDDVSIDRIGQWPWPRTTMAEMVNKLAELGAAVVAFDIVLPEAERTGIESLAKRLPNDARVQALAETLKTLPSGDQVLAEAVAKQATVMGIMALSHKTSTDVNSTAAFAYAGDDPKRYLPTFGGILTSVPVIHNAAAGSGALNWIPEFDQIVRKVPLVIGIGDKQYPSLAVEVLRVVQGASTVLLRSSNSSKDWQIGYDEGISRMRVGEIEVPTDRAGRLWLHFTPSDPRRTLSAHALLEGKLTSDDVSGRIILVGATASGLLDLRATPLNPVIGGVEVHAQAIEQMILGRHLQRPYYSTTLELAVVVLAGILLAYSVYRAGAGIGAIFGLLTIISVVGVSWYAYAENGILLDPSYPVAFLIIIYISGTSFSFFLTERERNRVRDAFGHYMAPSLVEQLVREPDRLKLGGETRELTLLFSDVRGFTSIAETYKDNPQGLTELMNQLLTPLSNAIVERRGVIDKYIGDAIVAFWNAPIEDPEHPANACNSALDMLERLKQLNEQRRSLAIETGEEFKEIKMGIGLSTGVGVVGNMGSDMRFDYSALGDVVNLASRLEGQTVHYGVPILASDPTIQRGAQGLATIEVDIAKVRGRDTPERLHGLFGGPEMAKDPGFIALKEGIGDMLAKYRAGQWDETLQQIERVRDIDTTGQFERLTALYEQRVRELMDRPLPDEWQGAWRMAET